MLLPALYDMPGRAADRNGHTEPLNYVHPAGAEKAPVALGSAPHRHGEVRIIAPEHNWVYVYIYIDPKTADSEPRPVCLAACDCEDGARAADLPSVEEGAQSRGEAAVTVIEEKQILDDGGIVGTSDGQVWSRYPNG